MGWEWTVSVIFWHGTVMLGAGWLVVLGYAVAHGSFKGLRLSFGQAISWTMLVLWLAVLMYLIYLSIPDKANFSLFRCWREAWVMWDPLLLKGIFQKVLAFVPLGVLLPFAAERFRKCRLALLAFAGTVLATETWQLMARRGDPDVDDLLHGLAGSLLGYFLVRFCLDLFKQKKLRLSLLLQALAIPAVFAAGIGTAFAVYILQPYGNLPISPIVKQDMSSVAVELAMPLAEEAEPAPVYRYTLAGDEERGRAVLSWVSALTRIQFEAPPAGRSSFSVSDASGEARFWYDGMDGSWRYWKPSRPGGRLSASEISTKREMLEGWLDSHGLLPGQVSMTIPGGSFFQWAVENAPIDESGVRYSGYCTAEFADDGSICRLVCSIRPTKETAAEPILSPKEAFEQISSGNFRQYITFSQGDQLYVEECSLVYMTDSKGFDQPCYLFGGACLQEDGTSRYWNAYCGAVRR